MTPPLNNGIGLTAAEVAAAVKGFKWEATPIMTLSQAAELLQLPLSTLYEWSSRGLLDRCSRKVGKRRLVFRDRLIQTIFNTGLKS